MPMSKANLGSLTDHVRDVKREAKDQWVDGKIRSLEVSIKLQEHIIKDREMDTDSMIGAIVHLELDRVMLAELKEMRGAIQPNEVRN